ncbi:hypothetical protein HCG49_07630 [Arenibacter sp. 6A1]|uniref:hypothetical protein n=1 Tax=Arenibacter sp. 6A1 TaxID=2720391 RepID=UPI0014472F77|nr:hypothetical protein [Arenibacter sp. 6A1]NKI26429.1 hypothetical protein [Arenibacter sp. 6A1]
MMQRKQSNRRAPIRIKMFGLLTLLVMGNLLFSQTPTKNHEFDFWIGEWNVYKFETDTIIGVSAIAPILNHSAIEEKYTARASQYEGKSFNIYVPKTDQWEQFWVDNSGLRLHLKGSFNKDKMLLSDCETTAPCNRIVWTKLSDASVRQEWEQSPNGGKTWKKIFDGHYKPRP